METRTCKPSRQSRLHRPIGVTLVATIGVVAAACSSGASLPADGLLALGTWGGDTSGMIVSDTAMHLHVGCTYGDVSGRIPLDANGNFDIAGSYLLRAYPVAVGPTMPARFTGHFDGKTVRVTVTISDTVAHEAVVRGPVTVRYGDEPQMGPCPICRRPIHTRRVTSR